MAQYSKPLTPEQIVKIEDEDIDFCYISESDASFGRQAKLVELDLAK